MRQASLGVPARASGFGRSGCLWSQRGDRAFGSRPGSLPPFPAFQSPAYSAGVKSSTALGTGTPIRLNGGSAMLLTEARGFRLTAGLRSLG
jgi:hypothetical protein